ncbi:MAG: glycoside hydrolase family 16 protein [Ferruginibacter sp.]|nr:glycoside hydrolase family 16 protein [Ferruginibacter sp.]
MKYLKTSVILLCFFFILSSCKKAGADSATTKTPPANLTLTALVSTDGTGVVAFTATADNAVSYGYEFGNGDVKTVSSGTTNYQYTMAGNTTYTVTVTAVSSSGLSVKKSIQVTVTVNTTVPGLFWSEEFSTDGAPDPAKWGYDLGAGGFGNQELQYYTSAPANVIVSGGVLKIKAIKETYSGSSYTSARMISKGKFALNYGKVEVRAKLPAGVGTWPAIWMLGSNISTAGWPACGEIDIMEHRGSELNKIFGTLHYPGRSGGNADGSTRVISNATTEFHKYSLDWSASSIKIFVDDVLFHTVTNSGSLPFNQDFFFILNIAMGGTFAGAIDPAFTNATMEVDYIRVYK